MHNCINPHIYFSHHPRSLRDFPQTIVTCIFIMEISECMEYIYRRRKESVMCLLL